MRGRSGMPRSWRVFRWLALEGLGTVQQRRHLGLVPHCRAALNQVVSSPCILSHPLFDTLYHAVALETEGALLVTADAGYLRKAARDGQIISLAQWGLAG